jgi:large subunit ribosomal protein L15
MKLHELAPPEGTKSSSKRVGRGIGSGHGKTSCRGSKGQKARNKVRVGFEGGQKPLYMRLPKHRGRGKGAMPLGIFAKEYAIVNIASLQQLAETLPAGVAVTPEVLREHRLVRKLRDGLRILGDGELKSPLTVFAHHFTKVAKQKIEAAGGKAELLAKGDFSPRGEEEVS